MPTCKILPLFNSLPLARPCPAPAWPVHAPEHHVSAVHHANAQGKSRSRQVAGTRTQNVAGLVTSTVVGRALADGAQARAFAKAGSRTRCQMECKQNSLKISRHFPPIHDLRNMVSGRCCWCTRRAREGDLFPFPGDEVVPTRASKHRRVTQARLVQCNTTR